MLPFVALALHPFAFRRPSDPRRQVEDRYTGMLLTIAILLLLFWIGGFAFHVAGGLIHILIVIAIIMFILHFIRGRRV